MWVHVNLLWQLSRDRNLHGSGMSQAMTASLKPSFRTSWRMGDTMVGSGNAEWTTSKTAQKGLLQKRLEQDLCRIVPHLLMTQSVKDWTEFQFTSTQVLHEEFPWQCMIKVNREKKHTKKTQQIKQKILTKQWKQIKENKITKIIAFHYVNMTLHVT